MMLMDITPFVNEMTAGLSVTLASQIEPDQAERLAASAQAPARLAMMGAVSQVVSEASSTLPGGRLAVQLEGANLMVVYHADPLGASDMLGEDDPDDGQARLTLRLPASVKAAAEGAAAAQGASLNAWVVRALRTALNSSQGQRASAVPPRLGAQLKGWI